SLQSIIHQTDIATPSIIKKAPYKAILIDNKSNRKVIRRDHSLAKAAIHISAFKCELDETHQTFLNKDNKPYMEAHHFIPLTYQNTLSYWQNFERNIDCVENIVSLCPNCHRMIHQANNETKKEILNKLFIKQKEKLESIQIKLTIDEVYKLYNV